MKPFTLEDQLFLVLIVLMVTFVYLFPGPPPPRANDRPA